MDITWIDIPKNRETTPFVSVADYAIAFNCACYKQIKQYGNRIIFGKTEEGFVFQIGNSGLKISTVGPRQDRGVLNNYKTIGKLHELGLDYGKYEVLPLNDSGLFKLILKEARE